MNQKCPDCGLINYITAHACKRCGTALGKNENITSNGPFLKSSILKRIVVLVVTIIVAVGGFYASLVYSADPLTVDEQAAVDRAIRVLEQKGFRREVFILRRLTVFRSNDNWLNASVEKENAYAATNFPFEIVTLYPDFFMYPADDTERAAILLHEVQHLEGKDEREAYEFVWKNREKLGWTEDRYSRSVIWRETRKMTRDHLPALFVCDFNDYGDCTAV